MDNHTWSQRPFLSFDPEECIRDTVNKVDLTSPEHDGLDYRVSSACTTTTESRSLLDKLSYDSKAGDFVIALIKLSSSIDLRLDVDQAVLVVRHLQLMLELNATTNLTSVRNPAKALVLHALDSLLFARMFTELGIVSASQDEDARVCRDLAVRCLDMGTGGGFPGIPLACVLPMDVTLLDSVGKKVSACNGFARQLGLNGRVHAIHERLEEFGRNERRSFDVIVARALASLDVLIEYAEPLVTEAGYLIISKGTPDTQELEDVQYVSKLCGFELVSRETIELPYEMGTRNLYVYKKVTVSSVKLPRKVGEARKHPLALRRNVSRETRRG